ncbi:MAG: FkbM family methyltransferase [Dehalococcoidia bacterium]
MTAAHLHVPESSIEPVVPAGRRLAVTLMNAVPSSLASQMRSSATVSRFVRPMVNRLVPNQRTEIAVRAGLARGLHMQIYPSHEKFYWTGMHEQEVQDAFASLIRSGMVVWDIGGHIGFTAMMASRLVGVEGQVHVFEPDEVNRERLVANLQLNNATNVVVHSEAVAWDDGTAFYHRHESSFMGSVDANANSGVPVDCASLDGLMQTLGVPDVIKIDVEGLEVEVLKGGSRLLKEHAPRLIVEFSDANTFAEAAQAFQSYHFQRIAARHWTMIKPAKLLLPATDSR